MLTLDEVADHWQLRPASVRLRVRSGELAAVRIAGRYRTTWPAVWSCESGGSPPSPAADDYRTRLLTKRDLADAIGVSTRTVERWTRSGLPTRSVGESIRFNRCEVAAWLSRTFEVDVHAELGALPAGCAR